MADSKQSSKNITLYLTCLKSDGKFLKFYALPDVAREQLRSVEHYFQAKSKELDAGSFRGQLLPDIMCCVKSRLKGQWCRARILEVGYRINANNHHVAVFLFDYGNVEVVTISEVRNADCYPPFGPLAFEYILADVAPAYGSEWSPEAVKYCETHLLFQTLSGYIVTEYGNLQVVRLAKLGESEPFVQRLINNGLAKIESIENMAKNDMLYNVKGYKQLPLEVDTTHLVTVSCVFNSRLFYIQLSPAENELKNLMESIDRVISCEQPLCLSSAVVGMSCLAQHNRSYYRATIRDVQQGVCKVLLVDYGTLLNKDLRELRPIPPHFMLLPAQAIACVLHESQMLSTEDFMKVTAKYPYLTCQVLGKRADAYIVNLSHQNKSIASLVHSSSLPTVSSYPVRPLSVGAVLDVTASYVTSPQEFYCQVSSFKQDLDVIVRKLEAASEFEVPNPSHIVPGFPICAKFSEDNAWYRAKVISVQDALVEVFFVDYGNTDKVQMQNIRLIPNGLLMHTIHGYKFLLHGFAQATVTDDIAEWFEDLLLESNIKAEIKAVIQGNMYSVTLYEENSSVSINEKLQNKLFQPTLPYPEVSNIENICITNFDSPNCFFGQLTKFDLDSLNNMQDAMNSSHNLQSSPATQVEVGNLVCAQFNEDGQFYRAVVESTNKSGCCVLFVDYGNRDVVDFKDIRKVNPKLLEQPFFGIECALDQFPVKCNANDLKSLLLDNTVQVMLLKQLAPGKWQVKFTESYAGNAEICSFLEIKTSNDALKFGMKRDITKKEPENITCTRRNTESHTVTDNQVNGMPNQALEDFDEVAVPSGTYKEVYVSHAKSPDQFYCQIVSESPKLHQLMDRINELYKSFKPHEKKLESLKVGVPCCIFYREDSKWYRGKIQECSNSNECVIFFVDYGYTETVSLTNVKQLLPEFFNTSPQALQCSMYNVAPKGKTWSQYDNEAFVKMFNKKSFIAQFVEMGVKGTHAVTLVDISYVQEGVVSKDFVKEGHGQVKDSSKLLCVEPLVASTSMQYLEPEVQLGSSERVVVTWIMSTLQVFCQLSKYSQDFKAMMDKIQSHYGQKDLVRKVSIDQFRSGMVCVAQFSQDGAWYRAKILDVKKNSVHVHYVDYGNEEDVEKPKVRYIEQDFLSLPLTAVKCWLKGLPSSVKDLPAGFQSLFEGDAECTFLSKEDNKYVVNLICNKKNVAQEIMAMTSGTVDTNANVEDFPSVVLSLHKNQLVNVTVTMFESPEKFWCQLDDNAESQDKIATDIESHCSAGGMELKSPSVGHNCLAKFSEDGVWYRARIKQLCTGGKIEVFFIDYGNTDVVELTDMLEIPANLLEHPAQAIECKLYGLPHSYDENCATKFEEATNNASEIMAKIENIKDGVCVVSLFDQSDAEVEVNIGEAIFGIGESQIHLPSPAVPTGEHSGYISAVNNPGDFYVQLESITEALEQFSDQLLDKYNDPTTYELLSEPTPGTVCCAKYSVDEGWYRAQITDVKGKDVKVLHVDYGSEETVDVSSLRYLDEDFISLPPFAIPCRLADVTTVNVTWSDAAVKKMEELKDKLVNISFLETSVPVGVRIVNDGISLNEEIIKMHAVSTEGDKESISSSQVEETRFSLSYPERNMAESKFTAKICFVESSDKFFITLTDWIDDLDNLMADLEFYNDPTQLSKFLLDKVQNGQCCAAKYSEDGVWYRAVVDNVDGNRIFISFVDYGNKEETVLQNILSLKPEFVAHPPFAVPCSLAEDQEFGGTDRLTALQTYCDDELTLKFDLDLSCHPYIAHILTGGMEADNPLLPSSESSIEKDKEISVSETISVETTLAEYPKLEIEASNFMGTICYVQNWNEFYIISTDNNEKLKDVMAMVKNQYEGEDESLAVNSVQKFQPCVAKYSEDDCWYRATVLDVDGDSVFLQFVDYGNTEMTSLSAIRKLTPELICFPGFALKCCLLDFVVNDSSVDTVIAELQTLADEEENMEIQVVKCSQTVHSVKIKTTSDLATRFIEENLGHLSSANAEPEDLAVKSKQAVDNSSDVEKEEISMSGPITSTYAEPLAEYPRYELEAKTFMGTICCVENWNQFYITSTDNSEKLKDVMAMIKSQYEGENESLAVTSVEKFQPCVAKYSEDDCWYRATVLDVDGDSVFLRFVDYGNTEMTSLSAIRKLTPELICFPCFALECCLSDFVVNDSAVDTVIAELQTLADEEENLEIEVVECSQTVHSVKIKTTVDLATRFIEENLGHHLSADAEPGDLSVVSEPAASNSSSVEKGEISMSRPITCVYAEPLTEYPKYELEAKTFVGTICCVENWNQFYITSTDNSEKLNDVMAMIKSQYEGENESLAVTSVEKFQPCVAKFSEDNCWYRATVLDVDGDSVFLRFVDYGNTEMTSLSAIRKLTPELICFPCFALKCCLSDFVVNDLAVDTVIAELQTLADEEENLEIEVVECSQTVYSVKLKTTVDLASRFIEENLGHCSSVAAKSDDLDAPSEQAADILNNIEKEEEMNMPEEENVGNVREQATDNLNDVKKEEEMSMLEEENVGNVSEQATDNLNEVKKEEEMSTPEEENAANVSEQATNNLSDVKNEEEMSIPEDENLSNFSEPLAENLSNVYELVAGNDENISKFLSYPQRQLTIGVIEAKICFVEAWNKFFVTAVAWESEFFSTNDMMRNCDGKALFLDTVNEGQPCIYEDKNGDFHRVVVIKVNPVGVDVHCVDVGCSYTVSIESLRQVSPELISIPVFAVECKLHELLPVENAEDDITEKFDILRKDSTVFELEVCVAGIPNEVKIKTDVDLSTQLVQEGLAVAACPSPERLHDHTTFKDNLKIAFVEDISDEVTKYRVPAYLLPNEEVTGFLQFCDVIDHQLVVHVVSSDLATAFYEQQAKLQEMYNESAGKSITVIEGDHCVAKSSDGCWYRVKVLLKIDHHVLVKFIDYGNTEEIPADDIKKLALEFSEAPQYAIECCVSGIHVFEEHDETVKERLMQFPTECEWKIKLCPMSSHKSGNNTCISSIEVEDIDIIAMLVSKGFAKQIFPMSRDLKIFHCLFVDIDSDHIIHLVLKDLIERRAVVQDSLNSVYSSFIPSQKPNVTSNQLYAVLKDSVWYRAVVCSIENDVTVLLVDFGIKCTVNPSDLRLLYPDFMHLSPFSVQCRLHGLPNSLNLDVQQEVRNILQNKDLTSIVDSFDHSNGYYNVRLSVEDKDVIEHLMHLESNSNVLEVDQRNPQGDDSQQEQNVSLNVQDNTIQDETTQSVENDFQDACFLESNQSDADAENGEPSYVLETCVQEETKSQKEESRIPIVDLDLSCAQEASDSQLHSQSDDVIKECTEEKNGSEENCDMGSNNCNEETLPEIDSNPAAELLCLSEKEAEDQFTENQARDERELHGIVEDSSAKSETDKERDPAFHNEAISDFLTGELDEEAACTNELMNSSIKEGHSSNDILEEYNQVEDESGYNDTSPPDYHEANLHFSSAEEGQIGEPFENQTSLTQRSICVGTVDATVLGVKVEDSKLFLAIIPVDCITELMELQNDLQKYYTSEAKIDACDGVGPCAILTEEGTWRRGEVLEMGQYASVSYWDIPCKAVINVEHVRKLAFEFSSQPPYCVWCTFSLVRCNSSDVEETLSKKLCKEDVSLEVLNEKNPCEVKLINKESVLQELITEGMLTYEVNSCPPPNGETLVCVSHFDELAPGIFLQLVDRIPNLDQLRKNMTHHFHSTKESLTVEKAANAGLYAVARDETFDRCTVLKQDGAVLLYFVDTGDCQSIEDAQLRPVSYDIALDPPYAYPCHAANLHVNAEVMSLLKEASLEKRLKARFSQRGSDGFYLVHMIVDDQDVLEWLKSSPELSDDLKAELKKTTDNSECSKNDISV